MNPIGLAALALVVGLAVGALGVWFGRRADRPDRGPVFAPTEPVVPAGVAEVLAVLNSSGVVVGFEDEVRQATSTARTLGLVRGSRIAEPRLLDLVRRVRREQKVVTTQLELTRAGVPANYLTVRVAPLGDDLILVLADDETGARRTEQVRRDFVANVSHELKTPVGAISLLAEAVQDAADDPTAVRKFAGRMGVESARLTDLVAQIIDLSRLQGDNPLVDPEVVEIDAVLTEAVDRLRVDADQRRVTLTVAGPSGGRVLGSARQLGVAVGNLVENAVVYSDAGARVVVAARAERMGEDEVVEISVSDNGIGIAPSEQERIFERFYRVDYARSRANGGTGLGLAIVKHIAAIHGGDVAVWSQVGRGSTFTLRLPAAQLPEPEADAQPAAEPVPFDSQPEEAKR